MRDRARDDPQFWRVRFSLRTLLLFMLLTGSAMTLSMRWRAWNMAVELRGGAFAHPLPVFSPDGAWLLARSRTGAESPGLILWDAATGQQIAELPDEENTAEHFAFSSDGRRVAAASISSLRLWDPISGEPPVKAALTGASPPRIVFSRDGKRVLSEDPVRIWNASTGAEEAVVGERNPPPAGYPVELAAEGGSHAKERAAFDAQRSARAERAAAGARAAASLEGMLRAVDGCPLRAVLSPCGEVLLTSVRGSDCTQLWDTASSAKLAEMKLNLDDWRVALLLRTSLGERLLAKRRDERHSLSVLDARSGGELGVLPCDFGITSAEKYFSATGDIVLLADERGWRACDVAAVRVAAFTNFFASPAVVSPDGRRATRRYYDESLFNQQPEICDARTGETLERLRHWREHGTYAAQFSPDGHKLLTNCGGGALIWQRRRPEGALGLLALPEFWLTVILAAALFRNVWRDREWSLG